MNTKRSILLAITIVLFAIGVWPIAFITLILMIPTANEMQEWKTHKDNDLRDEIEKLKKRLDDLEKNFKI